MDSRADQSDAAARARDAGRARPRADWGARLATGVAIYALIYLAWTCTGWRFDPYSNVVNALADFPAMAAAALLMARAGRAMPAPRLRRAWWLLAFAYAALIVGNAIYDYLQLVLGTSAFPSLGDAFFLGFFPCAFAGLLSFPERLGTRNEKVTFALDAATLMIGGGTMILYFVILPVAGTHTTIAVALSAYYPLVDMVLALGVVVILTRRLPSHARLPLGLMIVAFVALFVGDLVFAHDTLADSYVGLRPTDSFWTVSYALVAVAADRHRRAVVTAPAYAIDRVDAARPRLTSWLPYGAVLASLAVLLIAAWSRWDASLATPTIAMALLVAIVGARQVVAVRENARILAENTTRAHQARFLALVQHSSDVIGVVDRGGVVRYVSPSVERVLGLGVDQVVDRRLLELTHPDDHDAVTALLAKLVAAPTATAVATWRLRQHAGGWIPVEVVGTNGIADPNVAGLVLNARDVSERVALERAREQAQTDREAYQAQLLQAQKMEAIGRLAGGIAHDMNNALAAIIMTAECMIEEGGSPSAAADVESILLSSRRAAELTRNLLGFARRDAYRRESVRPESLITSVVTLLARTLPKGIKVETSFGDDLAAVEGDPAQLSHALVNLCINAADAMDAQGVLTIGAHRVRRADEGEQVARDQIVVSVHDTGTGMDAATQARMFEPFFTTKAAGKGTGLGLAMVYATVERHQGTIAVDSVVGRGTTFRISLPACVAVSEPPVKRPARAPTAPADGRAGRVLIIDDEPLLRATLQRALERGGFDVATAIDGRDGLAVLAREGGQFDVVLLDMAMPVLAGPETFRNARAVYPELRILLISGFTAAADARALLAEGAYGLLTKPFSPSLLLDAVGVVRRGRRVDSSTDAGLSA